MLDLESAIKHCEEVAETKRQDAEDAEINGCDNFARDCEECANEHRQLAEWLRKYQKIEQILDDYDLEAWEILEKIKEVVRV